MEFDSQAWYHWDCSNELDKNYQLLKDGNVHQARCAVCIKLPRPINPQVEHSKTYNKLFI